MIFSLFSSARFGKTTAMNLEVLHRKRDIIRVIVVVVVVVVVVVEVEIVVVVVVVVEIVV
jgi:hypothetical protein